MPITGAASEYRRSTMALTCGAVIVFLLAAVGCGGGAGGQSSSTPRGSASQPATSTTESVSPADPDEPLFSAKSASFSDSSAVGHGCPPTTSIVLTDTGPKLDENVPSVAGPIGPDTPGLEWAPACTRLNQQIDFDGNPVAKVSGSPSRPACQASAERSLTDGTALRAVALPRLSTGDGFCEYVRSTGRVIFMRVTGVSAAAPAHIDWEFTMWAGVTPTPTAPPQSGDVLYPDRQFTVSDTQATAQGCVPASVGLGFPDGPVVGYGENSTDGDLVYFPGCLGGPAKIRFGERVASVTGSPGATECLGAAAGSGESSLDVEVSALRVGAAYCEYNGDLGAVILIRVTAVSSSPPASVTFSATGWQAPDE